MRVGLRVNRSFGGDKSSSGFTNATETRSVTDGHGAGLARSAQQQRLNVVLLQPLTAPL